MRYALTVREAVAQAASGCTMSAGIAASISAARMATATAKPNGQRFVPRNETADFVAQRPLKELHGMGYRTLAKIATLLAAVKSRRQPPPQHRNPTAAGFVVSASSSAAAATWELPSDANQPFRGVRDKAFLKFKRPRDPATNVVTDQLSKSSSALPSGATTSDQHQVGPPVETHDRKVGERGSIGSALILPQEGAGDDHATERSDDADDHDDDAAAECGPLCADVLVATKGELQTCLGPTNGATLHELIRGVDRRLVTRTGSDDRKPPTSVGTSMNYAVRPQSLGDVVKLFFELSRDVAHKLERFRLAAGSLKVIVLQRHPSYPTETTKFLGCGWAVERAVILKAASPVFDVPKLHRMCIAVLDRSIDAITTAVSVGEDKKAVSIHNVQQQRAAERQHLGIDPPAESTALGGSSSSAGAMHRAASALAAVTPADVLRPAVERDAATGLVRVIATGPVPLCDIRGVGLVASALVPLDTAGGAGGLLSLGDCQISLTAMMRNSTAGRSHAARRLAASKSFVEADAVEEDQRATLRQRVPGRSVVEVVGDVDTNSDVTPSCSPSSSLTSSSSGVVLDDDHPAGGGGFGSAEAAAAPRGMATRTKDGKDRSGRKPQPLDIATWSAKLQAALVDAEEEALRPPRRLPPRQLTRIHELLAMYSDVAATEDPADPDAAFAAFLHRRAGRLVIGTRVEIAV